MAVAVAHPLELEPLAEAWQRSLDAAERSLHAASVSLPSRELGDDERALAVERRLTSDLLADVARVAHVPSPWLSPTPVTHAMVGLPATADACLFDLDGVLTNSGVLHARAWADVLDDFLGQLAADHGLPLVPFTLEEYRAYLAGRPRLDGVHAFLHARGITATDETASQLARRKGEAFAHELRHHGSSALAGARRFLEATGRAGMQRAVVTASANAEHVLRLARLDALVEVRIDAQMFRAQKLRPWPAPDTFLTACRLLDVSPERAVAFVHGARAVEAARAAGIAVVERPLGTLLDARIASATAA